MSRSFRTLTGSVAALALCLLGAARDPGVELRVDLARFEVVASDPQSAEPPLVLPIATGSPAHPTPTGRYTPHVIVRNPAWTPGEQARARGARRIPASDEGPMGVAKIPLTGDGFALHGGANPLLVGKPVSLGCVRLADRDMLALLAWLERARALGPERPAGNGEIHQQVRRRVAVEVR